MSTNDSGKLNMGGVSGIKKIIKIPPDKRTTPQAKYLDACLTALAHQPERWYGYQDWGPYGPVRFLAENGIEFSPIPDTNPVARSWYDGCECNKPHWRQMNTTPDQQPVV